MVKNVDQTNLKGWYNFCRIPSRLTCYQWKASRPYRLFRFDPHHRAKYIPQYKDMIQLQDGRSRPYPPLPDNKGCWVECSNNIRNDQLLYNLQQVRKRSC